jgi:leader peptidase (prepilin peptidase)/N-methyltransferase
VSGTDAPAAQPDFPAESAPIAFGVQVPFGPMLAAGGLVYFLFVHRWIDAYFTSIAELL